MMDLFQFINLPFYLITTIAVFTLVNSRLIDLQNKFFSVLLTWLLALTIFGLVTGVFGPTLFGWQTSNLVIPTATFVFLIGLAYSLIKFRVLQLEFIFYKIASFVSLIIVLGLSFTSLIFLFDVILVRFAQFRQFLAGIILALIAILVFQPLRIFLERTIGRIFFRNLTQLERLEEIDKILSQNFKVLPLASQFLAKVLEFGKITGAGLILFENRQPVFTKFLKLARPKRSQLTKFAKLTKITTLVEKNYSAVIPLIWREKNIGVLILGQKFSGVFFANELARFGKITQKATSPLVHAQAFDKIDEFNLKLKQTVEKSTHELAVANQKLAQIDRLKDEFVSLASHELRTPMTAIKSYLWMALSSRAGEVSGKLAKYLDLAYTSTERLIKLVNDLLNVTIIESGKINFHPQGVNIVDLTKTVIQEVKSEAIRRGLTITFERTDLPLVFADWNRIHEVLTNLVGNSLKFTPANGKIKISFAQKDDVVETSVTDTGKGITQNDMPRLFHKFGLIAGSLTATRETGGSGLGLYICKSLIDLHKGKIWAKSKLGEGSTFIFSLPIATEAQLKKFGIYGEETKLRKIEGNVPETAIPA